MGLSEERFGNTGNTLELSEKGGDSARAETREADMSIDEGDDVRSADRDLGVVFERK